jgi:hypothetical protein
LNRRQPDLMRRAWALFAAAMSLGAVLAFQLGLRYGAAAALFGAALCCLLGARIVATPGPASHPEPAKR